MKKIIVYDSTLRDGAQGKNISYTVHDRVKIVRKLDDLGIDFIEAGNPGSNPKELEFFSEIKKVSLKNSQLVAFGSTRRPNISVEEDQNIHNLLKAETEWVTVFGKCWDIQVEEILKTELDENLRMIEETVAYLVSKNKQVIFDGEHFFDGYLENSDYALQTLRAAIRGGAKRVCLCDTRGGTFPDQIYEITQKIDKMFPKQVGIHCHNDNGMAVAGTIMAVESGAIEVQGTFNGLGERCGNANLTTIIPNLQLFKGYQCIPKDHMSMLKETAVYISEVSNIALPDNSPYVGGAAFAHKAGMHADAISKNTNTYELISPEKVGNSREILMSEIAGRSSIMELIHSIDPTVDKKNPKTKKIMEKLKEMEFAGYQYEGAQASFELIVRKVLGLYQAMFELIEFKVLVNEPSLHNTNSAAMIKIKVDNEYEITAAEGDGPVNALDGALRKALGRFYPDIQKMKLTDYKVRVLDSEKATAAKVRVLIESTNGKEVWTTIGVSTDIIEASWLALVDSIEYSIFTRNE